MIVIETQSSVNFYLTLLSVSFRRSRLVKGFILILAHLKFRLANFQVGEREISALNVSKKGLSQSNEHFLERR